MRENVVTVRLLALCPMLAVSVSLTAAMTLGVLTLTVMALAGFCVSWVRVYVPSAVRLPIFLIIVATFVATADICLEASFADMHRQLGVFFAADCHQLCGAGAAGGFRLSPAAACRFC